MHYLLSVHSMLISRIALTVQVLYSATRLLSIYCIYMADRILTPSFPPPKEIKAKESKKDKRK